MISPLCRLLLPPFGGALKEGHRVHPNPNDTGEIYFLLRSVPHSLQRRDLPLATDTTQSNGTLNVTFPASGKYTVEASTNETGLVSAVTPQIFEIAASPDDSYATLGYSSATFTTFTYSRSEVVQITAAGILTAYMMESVQIPTTAPPNSNSTHRDHKTPIIIGAVIGCLVSLLIIFGGGTFLFKRKRRLQNRNLNHGPSPNFKIIPELNSNSPPVKNKNGEIITSMLAGGVARDVVDRNPETVQQNPERNRTEDVGNSRNSFDGPDASEPQSAQQQEVPQAAFGDVVAEVLRLRTQFQPFIEREAERVQSDASDPPPAYT
ncbi:hypothetical protein EDD85DRAFT_989082 [Armillaria nabsnona]|nr:hypothetical protein EDD85DRAFT_989082 [Armillaria nabsnona]